MIYLIIPHPSTGYTTTRFFASYSAAEQCVLFVAKKCKDSGYDPDWCILVAYDGTDELLPVFTYTIGDGYLHREPYSTGLL